MRYLLDSDWVIDALGGVSSAIEPIRRYAPDGIAVSIITYGEVFHGGYGFPNPQEHLDTFRRFFAPFSLLGLNDPIMEIFAHNRHLLQRQGNTIPDLDLLIAVTVANLTLVAGKLGLMKVKGRRQQQHLAPVVDAAA